MNSGDVLLSQTVSHLVPLALRSLTSEFGMRSGGTSSLWSPETVDQCCLSNVGLIRPEVPAKGTYITLENTSGSATLCCSHEDMRCEYCDKPHDLLVLLGSFRYTCSLSTL